MSLVLADILSPAPQMPKTAGGVVTAPESGEGGAFAEALKAFRAGAKEANTGEAGIAIAVSGDVTVPVLELPAKVQTETIIGLEAVLVPAVATDAVDPAAPAVETPPVLGAPVPGVSVLPVLPGETPAETAGETPMLPDAPDADTLIAAPIAAPMTVVPAGIQVTTDEIALKIAAAAEAPPAEPQLPATPALPAAPDADATQPDTAPLLEGRASAAGAPPSPPVLSTGDTVPALPKDVLENFAPRAPVIATNDDAPVPAAPVPQQPAPSASAAPVPAQLQAIASDPNVVSVQATAVAGADTNEDDGVQTPVQIGTNTAPRTTAPLTPSTPAPQTTQPVLTISEPELAADPEIRAKAADGALSVLTKKPDASETTAKPAVAPVENDAAAQKIAAPAAPIADPVIDAKATDSKNALSEKAAAEKPGAEKPVPADKPAQPNDARAAQTPVPVNDKPSVGEVAARSAQQQAQSLPATAIPQIASEFASKAKRGATRFEIRLDPPELGRIDVRIDVDKDGRVTSRLMVEKTETLDLLKADQRALERALHDAGFKSEQNSLSFSLKDDRGNQAKFADEQRQANPQANPGETEEEPVRHVADSAYRASLRGPGGFDLRV
jgi:flagellar hook-length control protein FliK